MLLNRILNVHDGEWSRISLAWLLRFLYRVGFVVGWTVIVAMFVGRNGISSLPYLFIINAGLTIFGSFIFSFFVGRFRKEPLLIGSALFAVLFLLVGRVFGAQSEALFFGFLLLAEAVFLVQFRIILDGYIEEMFSPLESERTFPLIEASETTGGILAGVLIMSLAGTVDTYNFVLFWVAILLIIVPVIVLFSNSSSRPSGTNVVAPDSSSSFLSKMKSEFLSSKHAGFVRGLLLVVGLQWLLYNLLEFQYTKAVYQSVSDVILDGGSGFEHVFVHDLGTLFVLFSASALAVQLFVGSRLINYLGIIGSMILHAVVTFLSFVGLFLQFSFPTAVLAKNNFTITSVIYTNAYHSAYYAIKDRLRDHTRELLEGVVRPLGAVVGTMILIILQDLFSGGPLIFVVNVVMLFAVALLFYTMYLMQSRYTACAIDDLSQVDDVDARINAIDILSQRGHRGEVPVMVSILLNEEEVLRVRLGILSAFALLSDPKAIPSIVDCFESKSPEVRSAALDALLTYKDVKSDVVKSLAVSYDLVSALKSFYRREKNDIVSEKIIKLLSRISSVAALEFLLDILKKEKTSLKQHALYALGQYDDESLVEFIRPYLKSRSVALSTAAAIVLYKYDEHSDESDFIISSLLRSRGVDDLIHGLFAVGELGLIGKKDVCERFLESRNLKLKTEAAIALAKLGHHRAEEILADLMLSKAQNTALYVNEHVKNVDVRIFKNVARIVERINDSKKIAHNR